MTIHFVSKRYGESKFYQNIGFAIFLPLFFYCLSGCASSAVSVFKDCSSKDENEIRALAWFYQGLEYEEKKDWKQAAVCFDRASCLSPHSSRIYVHLAWSLLNLDNSNQFKELALKKLALAKKYMNPNDSLLYLDMANAYHAAGEDEEAKECYINSMGK